VDSAPRNSPVITISPPQEGPARAGPFNLDVVPLPRKGLPAVPRVRHFELGWTVLPRNLVEWTARNAASALARATATVRSPSELLIP
jgi:hypothetical protein